MQTTEASRGLLPDGLFDSVLDDVLLDMDRSFHLLEESHYRLEI